MPKPPRKDYPSRTIRTTFFNALREPVHANASADPLRAVVRMVQHLQSGRYSRAVSAEVWDSSTGKLFAAGVITPTEFHIYYSRALRRSTTTRKETQENA